MTLVEVVVSAALVALGVMGMTAGFKVSSDATLRSELAGVRNDMRDFALTTVSCHWTLNHGLLRIFPAAPALPYWQCPNNPTGITPLRLWDFNNTPILSPEPFNHEMDFGHSNRLTLRAYCISGEVEPRTLFFQYRVSASGRDANVNAMSIVGNAHWMPLFWGPANCQP
jgi:hypothetical protein